MCLASAPVRRQGVWYVCMNTVRQIPTPRPAQAFQSFFLCCEHAETDSTHHTYRPSCRFSFEFVVIRLFDPGKLQTGVDGVVGLKGGV